MRDDLGRPVLATGGARAPDGGGELRRPVLAAGGDGELRVQDHRLPGAVALPPQEVAGRRWGAICQSPVNHLPLSLAFRGRRRGPQRRDGDEVGGGGDVRGHGLLHMRAQEGQQMFLGQLWGIWATVSWQCWHRNGLDLGWIRLECYIC